MSSHRTITFTLSVNEAAACRRFRDLNDDLLQDLTALDRDDLAHVKNVAQRLAAQFDDVAIPLPITSCCQTRPH